VTPAQTTVATWAAELAAVVVVDIVTNLLPASALAQLRAASGQDYAFIDGAVARVPVHTPTPSGGFVAEGGAIPVGALIIAALGLKPKKAGSITAITKELAAGSPLNVERSLRTLLALDLGLAIDAVLLSTPWPHQPRQPAYRTASRR
jgi:HK97 family phage major capsid protein